MKKNKLLSKQSSLLITVISCISILLLVAYFSFSMGNKGTFSVSDSCCIGHPELTDDESCWNHGYTWGGRIDAYGYCVDPSSSSSSKSSSSSSSSSKSSSSSTASGCCIGHPELTDDESCWNHGYTWGGRIDAYGNCVDPSSSSSSKSSSSSSSSSSSINKTVTFIVQQGTGVEKTSSDTRSCTAASASANCTITLPSQSSGMNISQGYSLVSWTTAPNCGGGNVGTPGKKITAISGATYYGCVTKNSSSSSSSSIYTITFMNAEGVSILGTCKTDTSTGKINASTCTVTYASVCNGWSNSYCKNHTDGCKDGINSNDYSSATVASTKWTSNKTLYCAAGTSIHDEPSTPSSSTPSSSPSSSKPSSSSSKSSSSSSITKSCYGCDVSGSKMYVYATSASIAATNTGGSNCVVVADRYCDAPENPKTGTTAIIIAWIVGLTAIGYSFWYFYRNDSIKNN